MYFCHDGKGNTLMHKRTNNCRLGGARTHWLAFDFKVFVDKEYVGIGEPEMVSELGWFSIDNLPEPLHSQVPSTFARYRYHF